MSLWRELKRRKVVPVALAYVAVAVVIIPLSVDLEGALQLPDWTDALVIVLVVLGFPISLILAWALELTPDGIKRATQTEPVSKIAEDAAGNDADALPARGPINPRSIAVLPFENMSPGAEDEYFAVAIHDEVLTQLAKLSTLKVISRTSVMEYRTLKKNLREIARELDVATVLEGGVQKVGDSVRINVQLIDAETDEHRWAESYDRRLTVEDILAIQREMASAIAEALDTELTAGEASRISEIPTRSTRAYNFYLMGNVYLEDTDLKSALPIAIEMYERAIDEDSSFVAAHARLSRAHATMLKFGIDRTEERRQKAVSALQRGIELDENHAEVRMAQATIDPDPNKALEYCRMASAMMPGDPAPLLESAQRYWRLEQFEKCIAQLDRAIELDPRNTFTLWRKASQYHPWLRQYDLADAACDRILEIAPSESSAYVLKHAFLGLLRGRSVRAIKTALDNGPEGMEVHFQIWATIALYERDYDEALRILNAQDWDSTPEVLGASYYCKGSFYGRVYQLMGDAKSAHEHFGQARDRIEGKLRKNPTDVRYVIALGEALAGLGLSEEASAEAYRAFELDKGWLGGQLIRADALKRVLLPAGDVENGIRELETYLAAPAEWSIEGLLQDPNLDPIRDDPRVTALVERYGNA